MAISRCKVVLIRCWLEETLRTASAKLPASACVCELMTIASGVDMAAKSFVRDICFFAVHYFALFFLIIVFQWFFSILTCFACARLRRSISWVEIGEDRPLRHNDPCFQVTPSHYPLPIELSIPVWCECFTVYIFPTWLLTDIRTKGVALFLLQRPTMPPCMLRHVFVQRAWCNTFRMHAAAHALIRLAVIIMADFAA